MKYNLHDKVNFTAFGRKGKGQILLVLEAVGVKDIYIYIVEDAGHVLTEEQYLPPATALGLSLMEKLWQEKGLAIDQLDYENIIGNPRVFSSTEDNLSLITTAYLSLN